jgi:hypothetical protein
MKRWNGFVAGMTLVVVVFCWHPLANAQGIVAFDYLEKNIRGAQVVDPLGSEAFGDDVSLFNGATQFEVFDIELKGNNALPVRLGRRLNLGVHGSAALNGNGTSANPQSLGGFGAWELSVPHVYGTFDAAYGWTAQGSLQRCSSSGAPQWDTRFNLQDIWSGVQLRIPGEGEVEVLRLGAEHVRPADGHAYHWGTRNMHRGRCIPAVTGLPGEGFEFVDSNGTTYRFDVALTRPGGLVAKSTQAGTIYVARQVIYLMASLVRDRHGNTVSYNYAGGRLTSIVSSDGRSITLDWDQNRVIRAHAGGRTWQYLYGSSFDVVNPDGSRWSYASQGDLLVDYQPLDADGCHYPLVSAQPYTFTAVHPSGARAVFSFGYVVHRISGTPANWFCIVEYVIDGVPVMAIGTPDFFGNYALLRKEITGPGLATQTWTYEYGQPETGKANFGGAYCAWCDKDKPVVVTQPDGTQIEYQFGALWGFNSGQLLAKYTREANGTNVRSDVYEHVADEEMSGMPFASWHGVYGSSHDASALRNRPVKLTTVTLGGLEPCELLGDVERAGLGQPRAQAGQVLAANQFGNVRHDSSTPRGAG